MSSYSCVTPFLQPVSESWCGSRDFKEIMDKEK